jgi:hypothetical protein
MANQVEPGTMGGGAHGQGALTHQGAGGRAPAHVPYHGRPVSWVAVSLIMAGFLAGGLALIFGHHGPTWWLFWAGAGVAAVGTLLALATDIFEDWY